MTWPILARAAWVTTLATIAALTIPDRWMVPTPAHASELLQDKSSPAADDTREEDRAAIRSALQDFARAFDSRDAKALASHWTVEGEYRNDLGVSVKGREALEAGFSEFFARTPELKTELTPKGLRFLSKDSAIAEGSVTVRRGQSEPPNHASYSALLVREEGQWLLAQLSETPAPGVSIEDLAWLIGEWSSKGGDGADIQTTYSWASNRKFIVGKFNIKEKELELSGTQVIGLDPATEAIRAWTFDADGGISEADWSPDGDHWVLDVVGTMADGSTLVETNILRRVSEDAFTWQSIDRLLDDSELEDLAPVKVVRIKPEH